MPRPRRRDRATGRSTTNTAPWQLDTTRRMTCRAHGTALLHSCSQPQVACCHCFDARRLADAGTRRLRISQGACPPWRPRERLRQHASRDVLLRTRLGWRPPPCLCRLRSLRLRTLFAPWALLCSLGFARWLTRHSDASKNTTAGPPHDAHATRRRRHTHEPTPHEPTPHATRRSPRHTHEPTAAEAPATPQPPPQTDRDRQATAATAIE